MKTINKKELECFEKAAAQGHAKAQKNLGAMKDRILSFEEAKEILEVHYLEKLTSLIVEGEKILSKVPKALDKDIKNKYDTLSKALDEAKKALKILT